MDCRLCLLRPLSCPTRKAKNRQGEQLCLVPPLGNQVPKECHRTHLDSDPEKKPISQTEPKMVETSHSGGSPGQSTRLLPVPGSQHDSFLGASLLGPWPPPSTWQAKELGRCCHGNQSWLSLIVQCPHALWVPSATPPPIQGFSRPRLPHTAPSLSTLRP